MYNDYHHCCIYSGNGVCAQKKQVGRRRGTHYRKTRPPEEKQRREEARAAEQKRLQEIKFKSDNPIKEIQARNHMRKSPADEYFERMKLAAAEVIKPKK